MKERESDNGIQIENLIIRSKPIKIILMYTCSVHSDVAFWSFEVGERGTEGLM